MRAHGTWTQTGGGGPDLGGLIQLAVLVGAAIGIALIIAEFAWLVISLGVAAVAVRLYLLHRKNLVIAAIHARGALIREEQRAAAAVAFAAKHRHELAVAAASAPRIEINNVIPDSMAALAAALNTTRQSYTVQAQPQPARVTIRGEVER
jgi:hypothetical protein